MSRFGISLLRNLTPEERDVLNDLVSALGGVLLSPTPASAPLPESGGVVPGNLLEGPLTWGETSIMWRDGVPTSGVSTVNGATIAFSVPRAFWEAVMRQAPRERWLPYTYLAALESDYVENAHNGDGEDSWGALQINRAAWPQWTADYLSTYDGNIAAAEQVYAAQGWGAWWTSAHLVGLM